MSTQVTSSEMIHLYIDTQMENTEHITLNTFDMSVPSSLPIKYMHKDQNLCLHVSVIFIVAVILYTVINRLDKTHKYYFSIRN